MIGTLTQLCADCAEVVGASAAGILLADGTGPLEMMAASSHMAADIDLYELPAGEGPCIEAFQTGQVVASSTGRGPGRALARLRPARAWRRASAPRWPARCAGTRTSSGP